jgi:cellulose biosynthesis protein BcsQ
MKTKGKVIGVLNSKGGVGKSTLALHLAMCMYHIRNFNPERKANKVVILDTDIPQYSLSKLRQRELYFLENNVNSSFNKKLDSIYSEDFPHLIIKPTSINEMIEEIELIKDNYDFAIVDVGAKLCDEDFNEDFLKCFDYILVPMNAVFEQMRSTADFVSETIIPSSKKLGFRYDIVLNDIHYTKEKYIKDAQELLENNGFTFLNTLIAKKQKYVSLKFEEPTGMYSSLVYTYDEPIYELIDEIINKFSVDVIEGKKS